MNKDQIPNDEEIKKNIEEFSNALDYLYEKNASEKLKQYNIIESDDHTSVTSSSNRDFIDNSNKETMKIKTKFTNVKYNSSNTNADNEFENNFKDLCLKEKSDKAPTNNQNYISKNSSVKRNSDFEIMFNDFYNSKNKKIENPFVKKLTKSDLDFSELKKYTKEHNNQLFYNDVVKDNDHNDKFGSCSLMNFKLSPFKDIDKTDKVNNNPKIKKIDFSNFESKNLNFLKTPPLFNSPEYNKIAKKSDIGMNSESNSNLNIFLGRNKRFKSD